MTKKKHKSKNWSIDEIEMMMKTKKEFTDATDNIIYRFICRRGYDRLECKDLNRIGLIKDLTDYGVTIIINSKNTTKEKIIKELKKHNVNITNIHIVE